MRSAFLESMKSMPSMKSMLCMKGMPSIEATARGTSISRGKATMRRGSALRSGEWAKMNGSRYCPLCLDEDGRMWKLRWKLVWSFACTKHHTLLRDQCEACGRTAGLGRGDMTATPAYLAKVARPGFCRNVPKHGLAGRGTDSQACGAELWKQEPLLIVPGGRVAEAQATTDRRIDAALQNSVSGKSDQSVTEFAQNSRALTALILLCGRAEDFCTETEELAVAVKQHLDRRLEFAQHRKLRGRHASRLRVFTSSGIDAALTAAALTPAIEIIAIEDESTRVDALLSLAGETRKVTRITHRQLVNDFQFSEHFANSVLRAAAATGSFGRVSRVNPCDPQLVFTGRFGPEHIPQLVPVSIYEARFQSMLPGVTSGSGRRFVAMAAVKSFGGTWKEAAEALDLPAEAIRYTNKAVGLINSQNLQQSFLIAIASWVRELKSAPIDYQRSRRRLEALEAVPPRLWTQFCRETNVSRGQADRRRRYVAAWLWAELTSGDWRLSPALISLGDTENAREIYRCLIQEIGDQLPQLAVRAQSLLRPNSPPLALSLTDGAADRRVIV